MILSLYAIDRENNSASSDVKTSIFSFILYSELKQQEGGVRSKF